MALRKDFATGTKYYYDFVYNFIYIKDERIEFFIHRNVRDTSDVDYDENETSMHYTVNVSDFTGYFDTATLDLVGNNYLERCYQYLKDNVESYNGWTDV